MLTPETIIELIKFAALAMSVDPSSLSAMPEVMRILPAEIPQIICVGKTGEDEEKCFRSAYHIAAIYVPSTNKVYYAPLLSPETRLIDRSYILHELVHYIQGPIKDLNCDQLKAREYEAYSIQDQYNFKIGEVKTDFAGKFQNRFECHDNESSKH
jgi:hypothetical protein